MGKLDDVINKINGVSETVNNVSGTAGALGSTIGNFVGNYQAARAGEATTARPINDIEIGISENTKTFIFVAIAAVGVFIIFKMKKRK